MVVERGDDLMVQVVLTPEGVTAFAPVDEILTSVPASHLGISVHHDGTYLGVVSEPLGYLSVMTGGGGVTAYGDYLFDSSDLPKGRQEIEIRVSYRGASATRGVSL